MGCANKLTMDLAKKCDFGSRYTQLCQDYSEFLIGTSNRIVDSEIIESTLNQFEYPYRYFKNEKFYRVYLLKNHNYEAWFHFQLYANSDSIDGYVDAMVYIRENKKHLAGSVFSVLQKEVEHDSLILRPVYTADVLPEILKKLIDIAVSYVDEFKKIKL